MENKDDTNRKMYYVITISITLILFLGLIFYLFFYNKGENTFGNISSYYLPIFSFGDNEFPPLEF
jgi:hypothetical protein